MPRQTSFILSLEAHMFILVEMLYLPALHCIPRHCRGAISPFLLGSIPAFEVRGPERVQLRVLLVVQFAVRAFPTLVQPVLNIVLVQRVVRFVVEPVSRTNTITVSAGVGLEPVAFDRERGLTCNRSAPSRLRAHLGAVRPSWSVVSRRLASAPTSFRALCVPVPPRDVESRSTRRGTCQQSRIEVIVTVPGVKNDLSQRESVKRTRRIFAAHQHLRCYSSFRARRSRFVRGSVLDHVLHPAGFGGLLFLFVIPILVFDLDVAAVFLLDAGLDFGFFPVEVSRIEVVLDLRDGVELRDAVGDSALLRSEARVSARELCKGFSAGVLRFFVSGRISVA